MTEPLPPSLDDMAACIRREIARRERVYPQRVADARMRLADADIEIATMRAVLDTLLGLRDRGSA